MPIYDKLRYEYDINSNPVTYLDVVECLNSTPYLGLIVGFDTLYLNGSGNKDGYWFPYVKLLLFAESLYSEIPINTRLVKAGTKTIRKHTMLINELLTSSDKVLRKTTLKFLKKYPKLKHRNEFFNKI